MDEFLGAVASMEEQLDARCATPEAQARAHVHELELARVRYVLRAYLRRRLAKLERYAFFALASQLDERLLSPAERAFVRQYAELLGAHLRRAFLAQLPPALQSLTDRPMVTAPVSYFNYYYYYLSYHLFL